MNGYAAAPVAFAQDYTVTRRDSTYQASPAGADQPLALPGGMHYAGNTVELPFTFPYYGFAYDKIWITTKGMVQLGVVALGLSTGTNATFPPNGTGDGMLAVAWDRLGNSGTVYSWTEGTTLERVHHISWEGYDVGSFQIQLHESSGRIVFAYATGGDGWERASFSHGIDAPGSGDSRFVAPISTFYHLDGHPGQDFVFDPDVVEVTGIAAYDRIQADANGVGNGFDADIRVAGARIELMRGTALSAVTLTDEQGEYLLQVAAPPAGATGSVRMLTQTSTSCVRASAGVAPHTLTLDGDVSLTSDIDLGTVSVGATEDPVGTVRAALHVSQAIRSLHGIVAAGVEALPHLEVLYDPASTAVSRYTPEAGQTAPVLRIGSPQSGNEDGWDPDVIARTYARHVLANIAGAAATPEDYGYDQVTDPQNAFAEAFGAYFASLADSDDMFVDAISANTGSEWSLETPDLNSARAPDVAGWVAGMLFDLADPDNELHDRVDSTAPGAVYLLEFVGGLSEAPDFETFLDAWISDGHDPVPLVRSYIHHGLIADDDAEPNDGADEPTDLGVAGALVIGRVLNRHNEDWYEVSTDGTATSLQADVTYDRATVLSDVTVEIRSRADAVLASKTTVGGTGPVSVTTAFPSAGDYRVRVALASGEPIPEYTVQAFSPLVLSANPLPDWTVGRDYDQQFGVANGIPPLQLGLNTGHRVPPGMGLVGTSLRGAPSAAGDYAFTIRVVDSGNPQNSVSRAFSVRMNEALSLGDEQFLALPLGRSARAFDRATGGTAPIAYTVLGGAVPDGMTLTPGGFVLDGVATVAGSGVLHVRGTDIAGSSDEREFTTVVCAPAEEAKAEVALAAGQPACGYFFDAAAGSSLKFKVRTAKKQPKRALHAVLLGPAGVSVAGGKFKDGTGKASFSKVIAPSSGRYFVVLVSGDGLDTTLVATARVKPQKKAKGEFTDITEDSTEDILVGALAGARATLKLKGDRKRSLVPKVVALFDPDGGVVSLAGLVSTQGNKATLVVDLPRDGTWTIRVGAEPGASGAVKWSLKVKQPKGAVFNAD